MRKDFPIFGRKVGGKKLIYFDSASTTQKPKAVIDAVSSFYSNSNSNVHRGLYFLSQKATATFEATREKVRQFINALTREEIVFVRGATEAINLAAACFGREFLRRGDEVLISEMEHHSNIVPWQIACHARGAKLRVVPITDKGELKIKDYEKLLTKKTKIVALTHVSNVLGTINPVKKITQIAHKKGAVVLVDGAQAAGHIRVDVKDLGCDFYAFSGHKMYGPTGIGVLYGKQEWLEKMPPYQGGGEMIKEVTFKKTTYNDLPQKFEAGTPDIAGVVGLGAAIDYINKVGLEKIGLHEEGLLEYGQKALSSIDGIEIFGRARNKTGIISFNLKGTHAHDLGTFLDGEGIAVRTGHHCCQPLMARLGVTTCCRASFGVYNKKEEIDELKTALLRAKKFFKINN